MDNGRFDIVALRNDIEVGRLDPQTLIKLINDKVNELQQKMDDPENGAKALLEIAKKTGGDFCGLGSKGRTTALALALEKTNETISSTNELIRGVIMLILCSATFANNLIKATAELFRGELKDADGNIVKVSEQSERFIRSVIEIAKSVVRTQTELQQDVAKVRDELSESFQQKLDENNEAIRTNSEKNDEQDRELARQRDKDVEHDKELARQRKKDDEHDAELDRQRKKDDEHDRVLAELLAGMEQLRHAGIPMWLKVIVFLNLILSVVMIGMVLLK